MRPSKNKDVAITAPVCPALIKASAEFSLTSFNPWTIEESGFDLKSDPEENVNISNNQSKKIQFLKLK